VNDGPLCRQGHRRVPSLCRVLERARVEAGSVAEAPYCRHPACRRPHPNRHRISEGVPGMKGRALGSRCSARAQTACRDRCEALQVRADLPLADPPHLHPYDRWSYGLRVEEDADGAPECREPRRGCRPLTDACRRRDLSVVARARRKHREMCRDDRARRVPCGPLPRLRRCRVSIGNEQRGDENRGNESRGSHLAAREKRGAHVLGSSLHRRASVKLDQAFAGRAAHAA